MLQAARHLLQAKVLVVSTYGMLGLEGRDFLPSIALVLVRSIAGQIGVTS